MFDYNRDNFGTIFRRKQVCMTKIETSLYYSHKYLVVFFSLKNVQNPYGSIRICSSFNFDPGYLQGGLVANILTL